MLRLFRSAEFHFQKIFFRNAATFLRQRSAMFYRKCNWRCSLCSQPRRTCSLACILLQLTYVTRSLTYVCFSSQHHQLCSRNMRGLDSGLRTPQRPGHKGGEGPEDRLPYRRPTTKRRTFQHPGRSASAVALRFSALLSRDQTSRVVVRGA